MARWSRCCPPPAGRGRLPRACRTSRCTPARRAEGNDGGASNRAPPFHRFGAGRVNALLEHLLQRATAQETSGHWPDAAVTYGQAFRFAVQASDPDGLLEVVIKLADCYRQAGEHEQAAEQ